mmetsp:Transcript_33315/g.56462  ORF Transcript_33315/g.56462 Transcript_33315/m.56462 type:complete len:253 (-) Transcript_33315:1411-2169(-)
MIPRVTASSASSSGCSSMLIFMKALLFICLTTTTVITAEGSFSHTIPYGSEECLTIIVPPDVPHIISGSFDILDTKYSTDPVRIALYNTSEKLAWESPEGASEGFFSTKGQGKHWLCLENGFPHPGSDMDSIPTRQRVTRTIGFAVRVKKVPTVPGLPEELVNDGNAPNVAGTAARLTELTQHLNENFQVLVDHMSFMKQREMVHRELHEQTFTKVVWWNILEIATVVIVTFGQVLNVWWILSKRNSSARYY